MENKNRKILITNDDGIDAGGIHRLAEAAKEFGEVWIIAPARQRSAASHSITLRKPVDITPYKFSVEGVHAYSCSGTPGDCVRVGVLSVMPEKPDVVLSGINFGYNMASDIQYSATAGAAFEAAFQGIHAVALSENIDDEHEVTNAYLSEVLREAMDYRLEEGYILNINFPGCPLSEFKGIRRDVAVSRESIFHDKYKVVEHFEGGGLRLMVDGQLNTECEEGTDFKALMENYISIGVVNNIGIK